MNNQTIKILIWNSRGIRNKLYEFFDTLIRESIDIALVNETWLKSDVVMNHPEYFCYRCDRESGKGGGVATVVRKNISHKLLPRIDTSLIENIGVKIELNNNSSLSVFSCYFPGGAAGPTDIRKNQFRSDLKKLSKIQGDYILGGDFNCRSQEWGCRRANCWGNILHDLTMVNTFDLVYPPEPTLVPRNAISSPSVIDMFITNIPDKLSAALTLNGLGSDHLPVQTTFNSSFKSSRNLRFNYKRANWKVFRKYINQNISCCLNIPLNTVEDIDLLIEKLTTLILNAITAAVPKLNISLYYAKRLPRNILNLISMRNKSRRNWIRYRLIHFKLETNFLNKSINEAILRFRNTNFGVMLSKLKKSSPAFWNISKIIKRKMKVIPSLKQNGCLYTTNFDKAEKLALKFNSNHYISANLSNQTTEQLVSESIRCLIDVNTNIPVQEVSVESLKLILKNLKNKKSPGSDKIPNRCLKALPLSGLNLLAKLFNACLSLCYFPKTWKQSKVIAIPKPGKDLSCPDSYRPISLLDSLSKILEKIIKEKVVKYINDNNVLPNQQFGFRCEHNTVQPLTRIKNIVKNNFGEGKSTAMVLLDIKSAFDSVWHDALIYKLIKIGLDKPTIKILQSFLTDRSFRVQIGNEMSNIFTITAGCPQGSCLSPILYNIFTHDFPCLNGCESSIFADDTAILSSGTYSSTIIVKLQDSIDSVVNYFNKWKILVNSSKTQSIFFSRKRKECFLPNSSIKINGLDIAWENNVKYLGVVLDKKMLFNDHISYTINKINIATKVLYPFINRRSKLNIENKLIILKVIFHAIIFYGAPVWHESSYCHIKRLQISQNKTLKMMCNLLHRFSTYRLHSRYNLLLVKDQINDITQKFNNRCSNSSFEHIRSLVP